jgi:predicted  nucleic acid-binding Zn-ribbon protein
MAGFVRLAHGVDAGEPVETPTVVRDRYVESDRPAGPDLTATAEFVDDAVVVAGETDAESVAVHTRTTSRLVTPDDDGSFEIDLDAATDADTVVVAAATGDDFESAGTAVERIRL